MAKRATLANPRPARCGRQAHTACAAGQPGRDVLQHDFVIHHLFGAFALQQAGAKPYQRDITVAKIHLLDMRHFTLETLETHAEEIAALIKGFLARKVGNAV